MIATNVSRSCSVRRRALVRSISRATVFQMTASGTPAASAALNQSPAAMDEPALVVASHSWQLGQEDPHSDPVDEPVIDHPFISTSVWCVVACDPA